MKKALSPSTRSLVFLVGNFLVYTQKENGENIPVLVLDSELKNGDIFNADWAKEVAIKNGKLDFLVNNHKMLHNIT